MMISLKEDLLDNEDSAVLGMLMSYKEPNNGIDDLITLADRVRESLVYGEPWL